MASISHPVEKNVNDVVAKGLIKQSRKCCYHLQIFVKSVVNAYDQMLGHVGESFVAYNLDMDSSPCSDSSSKLAEVVRSVSVRFVVSSFHNAVRCSFFVQKIYRVVVNLK